MADETKKPDTGPLRKNLAQVEAMVALLDDQLRTSGIAEFVVEREKLVALAALMRAPLKEAQDFLSDADVVVAITTGAGANKNAAGGLLVEHITIAIEQLRAATQTDDPSLFNLDELGRLVWQSRVDYCLETGQTAGGITPWEDLDEWTRESCRRAGEDLVVFVLEKIGYKRPVSEDADTGEYKPVER